MATIREAMTQGACIALGWDGEGVPPRGIRRKAMARLAKVHEKLRKAAQR